MLVIIKRHPDAALDGTVRPSPPAGRRRGGGWEGGGRWLGKCCSRTSLPVRDWSIFVGHAPVTAARGGRWKAKNKQITFYPLYDTRAHLLPFPRGLWDLTTLPFPSEKSILLCCVLPT
ncbi:unnamed protein product [Ectocarpus sp. 6 AP-2014]